MNHVGEPLTSPPPPLAGVVAQSGLVEGLVLHRAVALVEAQRPTSAGDADRRLGERLLELGALNPWQLDQLRRGRTKFTLGAYRIIDSVGRGGMGHVFKGEHALLGRVEAVKVLPLSKSTPDTIAGFLHEVRAQASLDHPNLVRVAYADRDGDTYYLVTEFVPGIDLRRLIRRRGPLAAEQAAWIAARVADALDHAHRRGVVHRDVKPGNVLLTPDGRVKVTDLGLAWSFDAGLNSSGVFGPGKVAGTSDYLAPESIREPDRVRPESDLYGLGCTLYYAVTGKVPYPGGSHADKLRRRLREPPRDPRELAPTLPGGLAALVRALMDPDPAARPASAEAVARELDALATPDARRSLAALVTDEVAPRRADDTRPMWASGESEELPETVGHPLHDLPPAAPPDDGPPRPAPAIDRTPWLVAGALLAAAAAIAASAAWRGVGG